MKLNLVIAMPVFNESDGIHLFVEEIRKAFEGVAFEIVVIDDFSTDDTYQKLSALEDLGLVRMQKNSKNLGHGPTTLKCLDLAIELNPDWVMTVDGDGQFNADDMRNLYESGQDSQAEIIEGIRSQRNDPLFRQITSRITRLIVRFYGARNVRDANTPLRLYKTPRATELRSVIPDYAVTPNLHISILSRRNQYNIEGFEVHSRDRLGDGSRSGTTWKARSDSLPSKKFIKFCFVALIQMIKIRTRYAKKN